jgi:hypothetical protein
MVMVVLVVRFTTTYAISVYHYYRHDIAEILTDHGSIPRIITVGTNMLPITRLRSYSSTLLWVRVRVFNATFNNISAISWREQIVSLFCLFSLWCLKAIYFISSFNLATLLLPHFCSCSKHGSWFPMPYVVICLCIIV